MWLTIRVFVAITLSLILSCAPHAQQSTMVEPGVTPPNQPQPSQRSNVNRANVGVVGVITGMEGGTYARTGADLTILDDNTLRVVPTLGKGSLQNLSDIMFLRGIDIGLVQADALAYAKQRNLYPNLTQSLRYIAKLFDEEIHVLVRKDILRLEDLNGQRINIDVAGSGSAMTAELLFDALGIKAKLENNKQINALHELKNGNIAGIIQVGGAPIPIFGDVPADSGLHFLPVPLNETLAQTYFPDQLTRAQYPALIAGDEPVQTLGVGTVMAVFGWSRQSERYANVAHFVDVFFKKFDQFQQPPRHPKWREVNLTAEVPGWTRFQPAQDWLTRQAAAGAAAATQTRFNAFLIQTNPAVNGALTDSAREALFQQFLTWERQRTVSR
jgi:TRAP transporter TAXI family solute receptor